ncbi:MAG: MFS transporter, partial [Enterobacteriaceae bacterium]
GSWMEHLRQLERYTMNDRKIQQRVQTFHQGEQMPVARYLVAPE